MNSPIIIPGWAKFQAYKRRTPPWIRLYRDLLNKPQWNALSGDAAKLLVELWLIASESDNREGVIHTPTPELAWRLRREIDALVNLLLELERQGFIEVEVSDACTVLATCRQDAGPETETEAEQRQRKPTPGVVLLNTEHTTSSLAWEAHQVLGMGLWGNEASRKFADTKSIIARHWQRTSYDNVYAAIHGLRKLVDAGAIEWLADCKRKPLRGLEVLVDARAILPGPDGGQLRSLFDASVEAYYADDGKAVRRPKAGPHKLDIDLEAFGA